MPRAFLRRRLADTAHAMRHNPRPVIYGGNDGAITTFAVVAGFTGASASESIAAVGALAVLIFGLANLFADGVSMGLSEYLSTRSQQQVYGSQRRALMARYANSDGAGRAEVARHLVAHGMRAEDADEAARLICRNPEMLGDLMMVYDKGMTDNRFESPALNGALTVGAFITFGAVPLIPYFFLSPTPQVFALSVAMTALSVTGLALVRARASAEPTGRCLAEMLGVGVVGASVAYGVGAAVALLAP